MTYGCYNIAYNTYCILTNTPASKFLKPENIFITGASSGLGEYLAYHYAKIGAKNIYICGRSTAKLDPIATRCREIAQNCQVHCITGDVTNEQQIHDALIAADAATPLSLVIANAGVSESTLPSSIARKDRFRSVIDTNVQGVLNTIFPLLETFKNRKAGQYMIVASIAAIASLPGNNPYAASKAAALSIGQSFRQELAKYNVGVTTICPGFVRSAMTSERHEKLIKGGLPMFMETEPAVKIMADGTAANLPVVVFPMMMGYAGWILRFIPFQFHDLISSIISSRMYTTKSSKSA